MAQYVTLSLTDARVLGAFSEIAKELGSPDANIDTRMDEHHQLSTVPLKNLADNTEIKGIADMNVSILGSLRLTLPNNAGSILVKRSGVTDDVTITLPNDYPLLRTAKLIAVTQKHIKPYARDASFDKLLGDELAEFYRKREVALLKLEDFNQNFMLRLEEHRKRLDAEHQSTLKQLQEGFEKRNRDVTQEYDEKAASLKEREESLAIRMKELDDRSSKHARRQLRQDLKKSVEQRGKEFELTRKTRGKRLIIHALFLGLIGLFGTVVGVAIRERLLATAQTTLDWYYLIKIPLGALATAAAIIYYIRWNDDWFKKHADEEFNVKRFELDIDRASWVVEMALEWKDEKGSEIPKELTDRLTANLFQRAPESEPPKHPSQDLASALLGATSELSLNVPGLGNLKLDRRGTKSFGKAIDTQV